MSESRRPHFQKAVQDFMGSRGIEGYTAMANDFVRAVYPGNMYTQLLRGWVSLNQAVPDAFYRWLHKTYDLSYEEQKKLIKAYERDVFGYATVVIRVS
jgi:hypothetical protein